MKMRKLPIWNMLLAILSNDVPENSIDENIVSGNHESNNSVVKSPVERREIITGDYVIISKYSVIVEPNDATEFFGFFNSDNRSVFVA